MKILKYDNRNAHSIRKWYYYRTGAHLKSEQLPELGFIVPGVAACFIRRCEGKVAMLEALVTNPLVSKETRHRALESLYARVTSMPYARIIGFTRYDDAAERAVRWGFKEVTQKLLVWENK